MGFRARGSARGCVGDGIGSGSSWRLLSWIGWKFGCMMGVFNA